MVENSAGTNDGSPLMRGVVGLGQVGRAAPQLGQHRGERVQHLAGGGAGGDALRVGGRTSAARRPSRRAGSGWSSGRTAPCPRRSSRPRRRTPPARWLARPGRARPARGCGRGPPRGPRRSARGRSRGSPWWRRPRRRRAPSRGILPVFCVFGAGQPMIVRSAMRHGRSVTRLGLLQRRPERLDVLDVLVAVVGPVDGLDVPAVGLVARRDVLAERDVGVVLDRDLVVVVDHDEVAQLLVAGERGRLVAHALLDVAVAAQRVDVVVEGRWRPRRRPGRAGRARGGRPSPCRPRCRRPGRAGRWWSRRRRCGRARGGPGSSSPRCAGS